MNFRRLFWGIAGFCLISADVFAQSGFTGKWQSDQAVTAQSQQAAQAGSTRGGRGRTLIGDAIVMELKVDGDKLSGTVQEIGIGKPLTIMEGMIVDKTFSFKTVPPPGPDFSSTVTWNGKMLDDNTISVSRTTSTTYRAVARGGGGFRGGVPVDPPRGGTTLPPPPTPEGRNEREPRALTLHRAK
jgi:hypothetical protein